MPISSFNLTVQDGQLGLVEPSGDAVQIKLGVSSSGTTNTLKFYSTLPELQTDYGTGPLVEAAACALGSGCQVGVMRIAVAGSGSAGSVTASGGASGTVATTGSSPKDNYSVIVQLTKAGAVGTAEFKFSLDGGNSYSPVLVTASSYAVPASLNNGVAPGVTFAFSGTFTATESHSFSTTAPAFTNSELGAALDALLADPRPWNFLHVVGIPADAATAATFCSTVDSKLSSAANAYRYAFGIVEMPNVSDATLISAFASFTSTRTVAAAGFCDLISDVTSRKERRPAAWPMAARLGQIGIGIDPAWTRLGPLRNVRGLTRDEFTTPGLDAAKFSTLRSWPGKAGYYVGEIRPFYPAGSDFQYITARRVMDAGCRATYDRGFLYSSQGIQINKVTGKIREDEALGIEEDLTAYVSNSLGQNASSVQVIVNRTDNILSTKKLRFQTKVIPLGYAKEITAEVGFLNPALVGA